MSEIWRAFGLKPWRQDEFKVYPDPDLIEKIRDLVGLYMSPPVTAAVYAVDEKPQIQALDRSALVLPMLPTTPQNATHDYVRNGTLDLVERWFSALTTKKLQRSAHRSVKALAQDIHEWVENWNENPRPFVWHKTAEEILDRLAGYIATETADSTLGTPGTRADGAGSPRATPGRHGQGRR